MTYHHVHVYQTVIKVGGWTCALRIDTLNKVKDCCIKPMTGRMLLLIDYCSQPVLHF